MEPGTGTVENYLPGLFLLLMPQPVELSGVLELLGSQLYAMQDVEVDILLIEKTIHSYF